MEDILGRNKRKQLYTLLNNNNKKVKTSQLQCYWNNHLIELADRNIINALKMKIIEKLSTVSTTHFYNIVLKLCTNNKHIMDPNDKDMMYFYLHELDHLLDSPLFNNIKDAEEIYNLLIKQFDIAVPNYNNQFNNYSEYIIWANMIRDIIIQFNEDINIIMRLSDILIGYITIKLGPTFEDYYKGFPDRETAKYIWRNTLINNSCINSYNMLNELYNSL